MLGVIVARNPGERGFMAYAQTRHRAAVAGRPRVVA
jgi:hypothetical protein